MAEIQTKIVIIRADGRATVYPRGTVDIDSTASTVVQDIKEILQLNGEYDLYIKVNPRQHLSSLQVDKIEAIAVLSSDVKPSRSVDLGQ